MGEGGLLAIGGGHPLQWIGLRATRAQDESIPGFPQLSFLPSKSEPWSFKFHRVNFSGQTRRSQQNLVWHCGLTPMAFGVSNAKQCRLFEPQNQRNVRVEAGRSKKKAGQSSSGRLEGRADQRRAARMIAERRRALRERNRPKRKRIGHDNEEEEEEFTEDELQMIGLGYDRTVRFKDQNDPSIRHPYDWYKYGPYGPYAWKGIVVGKPVRGTLADDRVSMFSSVRDEEEWEKIEQRDAAIDYNRRVESFDAEIGTKYFWVFIRGTRRVRPELPWNEWTLVCEVAVESGEKLDKYRIGSRLDNKARNLLTRCAAWFRPDLVYVRKPIFQARFEPQEDFLRGLMQLVDPLTEQNHRFLVPVGEEEGKMDTYYGCLCRILGVDVDAPEDDVVSAYEKLDEERRSQFWDFLLSNQPVELLHPFTRGWKAREDAMAKQNNAGKRAFTGSISSNEVGLGGNEDNDEWDLDAESEGEDEEYDVEKAGIDSKGSDEETSGIRSGVEEGWEYESRDDDESLDEQEMFWEKEFENAMRDLEEAEDTERDNYGAPVQSSETNGLDSDLQSVDDGNKSSDQSRNRPELLLRAAVRPFTYQNLFKEVVFLRQALIEESKITNVRRMRPL